MKTTCDLHSSAQEITMHEDLKTKYFKINLSTPHQIIKDNINNSLAKTKKEVTFKYFDHVGIKLKSEILNYVIEIEKEFNCVTVKNRDENHIDMSNTLIKLAAVDIEININELSIYYKFVSEQLILMKTSFNKRIFPENSIIMACRLQLHKNSTSRHESIGKYLPFLLFLEISNLFDVN